LSEFRDWSLAIVSCFQTANATVQEFCEKELRRSIDEEVVIVTVFAIISPYIHCDFAFSTFFQLVNTVILPLVARLGRSGSQPILTTLIRIGTHCDQLIHEHFIIISCLSCSFCLLQRNPAIQ
jgi:hypothetical protein